MVINGSVQYIIGGFLSDIILFTLSDQHWGTRLISIKSFRFYYIQPMFPPKPFDKFSADGGCSE